LGLRRVAVADAEAIVGTLEKRYSMVFEDDT
jgi:hypothetical protein